MYVCLCHGVSDRQIQQALDEGACSVTDLMRCTGAGTQCGTCHASLEQFVESAGTERGKRDGGPHVIELCQLVTLRARVA